MSQKGIADSALPVDHIRNLARTFRWAQEYVTRNTAGQLSGQDVGALLASVYGLKGVTITRLVQIRDRFVIYRGRLESDKTELYIKVALLNVPDDREWLRLVHQDQGGSPGVPQPKDSQAPDTDSGEERSEDLPADQDSEGCTCSRVGVEGEREGLTPWSIEHFVNNWYSLKFCLANCPRLASSHPVQHVMFRRQGQIMGVDVSTEVDGRSLFTVVRWRMSPELFYELMYRIADTLGKMHVYMSHGDAHVQNFIVQNVRTTGSTRGRANSFMVCPIDLECAVCFGEVSDHERLACVRFDFAQLISSIHSVNVYAGRPIGIMEVAMGVFRRQYTQAMLSGGSDNVEVIASNVDQLYKVESTVLIDNGISTKGTDRTKRCKLYRESVRAFLMENAAIYHKIARRVIERTKDRRIGLILKDMDGRGERVDFECKARKSEKNLNFPYRESNVRSRSFSFS